MINTTLSIVDPTLKNNYIQTILDVNIDENVKIKGYENELVQAFINIINNTKDAINEKISQEAERYLFVSVCLRDKHIDIIFKDNAGGIDSAVIDRIFEPYFTTKHKSVGTGLGLSMAYKIITQRHNGSIVVENSSYKYNNQNYTGAMFTISFESSIPNK
ncbi:MAG: HAMP domain-containing histidine kinase [Arcobacter sp.]|nr:HAMP domain-containing histidine kinase [Arcobacter sp.]